MHIASLIFSSGICTLQDSNLNNTKHQNIHFQYVFYNQKSTHFIHKSIQYYIKIIDNSTKHQKILEPAQLMSLGQLSQAL